MKEGKTTRGDWLIQKMEQALADMEKDKRQNGDPLFWQDVELSQADIDAILELASWDDLQEELTGEPDLRQHTLTEIIDADRWFLEEELHDDPSAVRRHKAMHKFMLLCKRLYL